MSIWISVYDKLPRKNEKVCVSDGVHTWDCGTFRGLGSSKDDVTWWIWKGNTVKIVKWWMPKNEALPPVPQEAGA